MSALGLGTMTFGNETDQETLARHGSFGRISRKAVAESVGPPSRVHDLRHTHAAWMIADGEHPKAIQTRLGRGSMSVTMDRYGHLMDGLDDQIAVHLDAPAKAAAPPARPEFSPTDAPVPLRTRSNHFRRFAAVFDLSRPSAPRDRGRIRAAASVGGGATKRLGRGRSLRMRRGRRLVNPRSWPPESCHGRYVCEREGGAWLAGSSLSWC
jgi:hypothetical protein